RRTGRPRARARVGARHRLHRVPHAADARRVRRQSTRARGRGQTMKVPARFITSAAAPADFPPPSLPEVAVVGRENVGKSSLINAMVGQAGLARTSRTPGRTRLINWFEVEARPTFHLVDLPGYGYAEVSAAMRESWRPLIETYLADRTTL